MATIVNGHESALPVGAADLSPRQLLRRLTVLLLAVGVGWRILRYLLDFPLWGDEAMVCLNFLELDYRGLTQQLHHCQVAPLLFLWGELTVLRLLGDSALALRLLPFLAGMGALLLFWQLCRVTLRPLARTLALGFLAVAVWPVSMGTCAKPYAGDLFMALLLLVPAAYWLRHPERLWWPALLILATPLAVFGSYPVVFIGGAISCGLLPLAWRDGWKARLLWAGYNAALVGSFVGNFLIVGTGQLRTICGDGTTTTAAGMQLYWTDGFPPAQLWPLIKWFVLIHTGQMMAYPIGAADGGSALTALLCLAGLWQLWRMRRRELLVICTAPFALWFIAALLHRYPYGASGRLSQHIAPLVCLTAGLGMAGLLERIQSSRQQRQWLAGIVVGLLIVAAGGITRDFLRPYHDREAVWTDRVMRELAVDAERGVPMVILNEEDEVDPLVRWHFKRLGDRVWWNGQIDEDRAAACGELVCLRYHGRKLKSPLELAGLSSVMPGEVPLDLQVWLARSERPWTVKNAVTQGSIPAKWDEGVLYLDRFDCVLDRSPEMTE